MYYVRVTYRISMNPSASAFVVSRVQRGHYLLKSGMSRVYGVHNMFSAEKISSVYAHCQHREFERCEKETRAQDRHLVRDCWTTNARIRYSAALAIYARCRTVSAPHPKEEPSQSERGES